MKKDKIEIANSVIKQTQKIGQDELPVDKIVSKHEYKILKEIAYCVNGMFGAENDKNLGDAEEWKRAERLNKVMNKERKNIPHKMI